MERNRKLFYQIADVLETYPEKYNQEIWGKNDDSVPLDTVIYDGNEIECGTAHCIAGWAALLTPGVKPSRTRDGEIDWVFVITDEEKDSSLTPTWAARELGLSHEESHLLFGGGWKPVEGMTPSDALRALGDGANIEDVTDYTF